MVLQTLKEQIHHIQNKKLISSNCTIFVQGKAGTGKSTLIHLMIKFLNQQFGQQSYALVAPTGAAALNINGSTIHSKFAINCDGHLNTLANESLNRLQNSLRHCQFLIIDEISMVGCALFRKIDLRCRSAKPKFQHLPFAGMFVYLFGDIKQLPPVRDRPLYSNSFGKSPIYSEGHLLFQQVMWQ